MKKVLFLLAIVSAFFLSATHRQEAATITSVTHTNAGDVVCWNYTATDNVDCVTMEVKSKATGNVFKTTVGSDGQNCLGYSPSGSGCNTYPFTGAKGRTYRLRIIREDLTSYYSNEVSL
jgi:hypothetical protein